MPTRYAYTSLTPDPAGFTSGTYTPSLGGVNAGQLDSTTPYVSQWMQVGNVVTLSGRLDAHSIVVGAYSNFTMTLPVTSAFVSAEQLAGSGAASGSAGAGSDGTLSFLATPASNTASVTIFVPTTGTYFITYTLTYLVI